MTMRCNDVDAIFTITYEISKPYIHYELNAHALSYEYVMNDIRITVIRDVCSTPDTVPPHRTLRATPLASRQVSTDTETHGGRSAVPCSRLSGLREGRSLKFSFSAVVNLRKREVRSSFNQSILEVRSQRSGGSAVVLNAVHNGTV